jgi:hypothetical protein
MISLDKHIIQGYLCILLVRPTTLSCASRRSDTVCAYNCAPPWRADDGRDVELVVNDVMLKHKLVCSVSSSKAEIVIAKHYSLKYSHQTSKIDKETMQGCRTTTARPLLKLNWPDVQDQLNIKM